MDGLPCGITVAQADNDDGHSHRHGYKHVLLISVDGMHAVDLKRWVQSRPGGDFAKLSDNGVVYPNAFTTAPSDSFPGMLAQVTGATPKQGGLFYDDSYDRTEYPAKAFYTSQNMPDPGCTGSPGTEVTNFEELDVGYNFATALVSDITGGGTLGQVYTQLDPNNMQRKLINGQCEPVFPHQYLRTNTIFEVIKKSGGLTAWSDKHPAYEVLSGPSGKGIDDLYTPEINSQVPGAPAGDDYTTSYSSVQTYDTTKVNAVINWIDGLNSTGTAHPGVPAVFGMNFQAVSVGQKVTADGYTDANGTPSAQLELSLDFVDNSLGQMLTQLDNQHLTKNTLIIVGAKHGQSPIDVGQLHMLKGSSNPRLSPYSRRRARRSRRGHAPHVPSERASPDRP